MLWQRVISAAVGIPIVLLALYLGGFYFLTFSLLIAALAASEFYNMFALKNYRCFKVLGIIGAILMVLLGYYQSDKSFMYIFPYLIILITAGLFRAEKEKITEELALTLLGSIYTGGLFAFLNLVRETTSFAYTLMIFIMTWANDSGAYFVGKALGKHKLSPIISPKKTIEGAIGGLLFSVLAGVIGFSIIEHRLMLVQGIAFGMFASVAAQIGDLVESMFKRQVGIKDSGKFMPGHGGVLDRFDSILFVAPVVYFLILAFR